MTTASVRHSQVFWVVVAAAAAAVEFTPFAKSAYGFDWIIMSMALGRAAALNRLAFRPPEKIQQTKLIIFALAVCMLVGGSFIQWWVLKNLTRVMGFFALGIVMVLSEREPR